MDLKKVSRIHSRDQERESTNNKEIIMRKCHIHPITLVNVGKALRIVPGNYYQQSQMFL